MLKFLAVLVFADVVFGACKTGELEVTGGGTTKIKVKWCKKGCYGETKEATMGLNDTSCKACKDIKETTGSTKEQNCKNALQCYWKVKCLPGSCPSIVARYKELLKDCKGTAGLTEEYCETTYGKKQTESDVKAACKHFGCLFDKKNRTCSIMSLWALIVIIIAVVVVILIIIVVVIIIILLKKKKPTTVEPAPAGAPAAKAGPPQATPAGAAPADAGPPPEVGPYIVIKLGKQELKTKKVESAVWGQDIIFTGLGPEDDDVVFELHDDSDALLGSTDVRIPDYVNAKKRAAVILKNGEADIGVLEVDIEIQVQEEPEVKITGVFLVDKFVKSS